MTADEKTDDVPPGDGWLHRDVIIEGMEENQGHDPDDVDVALDGLVEMGILEAEGEYVRGTSITRMAMFGMKTASKLRAKNVYDRFNPFSGGDE